MGNPIAQLETDTTAVKENWSGSFESQDLSLNSARLLLAQSNRRDLIPADPAGKTGTNKHVPELELVDSAAAGRQEFFPWTRNKSPQEPPLFMGYGQMKDALVKIGEGPYHVSRRLLGSEAAEADVKALSKALSDQYRHEHPEDDAMKGIIIGQSLLNRENIESVLLRIEDYGSRIRISERLAEGWVEKEPPKEVPFDARQREGETRPDRIDDPEQFLKDLAQSAIEVKAAELRARGLCAQGARLSFNQLPLWHIEGGKVDKSINKDPNGWRSGITLAQDLAASGLFDVVPLKELGYKNLKEGYVLGRIHYPDYVKKRPSWDGEDMGDIDIVTKKHRPPNDGPMYHSSFVLIPKGLKR